MAERIEFGQDIAGPIPEGFLEIATEDFRNVLHSHQHFIVVTHLRFENQF
jgi:hypothetical protein